MTPIQWALVELPYLSQDFVIMLALVYLIIGMVTVFLVPMVNVVAGNWRDSPSTWYTDPLSITLAAALWPCVLWFSVFDD